MSTPAPLLGPTPLIGTGTTIASDTLIGTDPPVSIPTYSSNWTLVAASSLSVGAQGAQIYTAGITYNAALNSAAIPNDQFVQFTINKIAVSGYMGVVMRASVGASGVTGYTFGVNTAGLVVNVVTNGALTTQLLNISRTFAIGDVIRCSIIGISIYVEVNGVLLWRGWNNSSFASGSVGLYGGVAPSACIINWSAGSVVYAIPTPGFTATPGFFNAASGASSNVWKTATFGVDVGGSAGFPPGVSGLIMMWSSPNSTTLITRPTGSTFNVQPPVANAPAAGTQGIFHTGVSLTGTGSTQTASFDYIASTITGLQFWTVGYYGAEAVFFDPPISITVPGTFPGTISLAAQIPASAVAIFANLWGDTTRIVPHGDADIVNYHPTGLNTQSVICGVTNQQIDITAATGTTPVLYLRGYLKYGFTWRTPPAVVTPGTTGAMALVAFAPGGYVGTPSGFLYEVNGTVAYSLTGGFVSGGTYKPVVGTIPQSGNTQGVSAGPQGVANVTAGLVLAEQGYFVSAVPATAPTAATKAYLAVKTTSQS